MTLAHEVGMEILNLEVVDGNRQIQLFRVGVLNEYIVPIGKNKDISGLQFFSINPPILRAIEAMTRDVDSFSISGNVDQSPEIGTREPQYSLVP